MQMLFLCTLDFCAVLCMLGILQFILLAYKTMEYNEMMNHCNLRRQGKFLLLWAFLGTLFTFIWKGLNLNSSVGKNTYGKY